MDPGGGDQFEKIHGGIMGIAQIRFSSVLSRGYATLRWSGHHRLFKRSEKTADPTLFFRRLQRVKFCTASESARLFLNVEN
jgi:hypothetical protein